MHIRETHLSAEEPGRLGDAIYDRDIRSQVEPSHNEKIVAIDVNSGAWELNADERAASRRLGARMPDAQIWIVRVGSRYVRRFGAGRRQLIVR